MNTDTDTDTDTMTDPTTETKLATVEEVEGADTTVPLARVLGMAILAQSHGMALRVRYVPPRPAPASGSAWPESLDWPGIEWAVTLPVAAAWGLAEEYWSTEDVWGEVLDESWGRNITANDGTWLSAEDDGGRIKRGTVYASTLEKAEKYLLEAFAAHADTLAGIAARRNARLAERAERLRTACLRPGAVVTAVEGGAK